CLGVLAFASASASADDYPNKTIRFIVCFAAGGPDDITARLFGQYLSEKLGQQFIIENRVGAGGNIGTQAYLSAPPDGYTIGFVGPNNFISASLYAPLPFDFIRDSEPVGGTMKMTNVLEVNNNVPIKSVAEYIAYAKANPGKLNVRHAGAPNTPTN